ncbi:jg20617 [Pararge aegeria aegeria]|uniref:Jg20617 protein n=1 Tax=Pararge aegeria aegeria TaxID=348720 RepID=A0A8S4R8G5_9NEOP|nr:jg20617 [Pararge aegeria aegeria]
MANPAPWNLAQVNAALVGPKRGGQTTSNESLGAAESKRPRNMNFGTPYKRPMSSSGRLSVDVMMMMMTYSLWEAFGDADASSMIIIRSAKKWSAKRLSSALAIILVSISTNHQARLQLMVNLKTKMKS